MSSLKHTPGPWKFNIKKENGLYQISGENGSQIGRLWGNKYTDANARLISAAPEMLDALIEYVIEEGGSEKAIKCIESATGLSIEEVLK